MTVQEILDQIIGKRLILRDDRAIQVYRFHESGSVAATLGEKGGAVTAPILQYSIEADSLVVIYGRGKDRWHDLVIQGDELIVNHHGRELIFDIR